MQKKKEKGTAPWVYYSIPNSQRTLSALQTNKISGMTFLTSSERGKAHCRTLHSEGPATGPHHRQPAILLPLQRQQHPRPERWCLSSEGSCRQAKHRRGVRLATSASWEPDHRLARGGATMVDHPGLEHGMRDQCG